MKHYVTKLGLEHLEQNKTSVIQLLIYLQNNNSCSNNSVECSYIRTEEICDQLSFDFNYQIPGFDLLDWCCAAETPCTPFLNSQNTGINYVVVSATPQGIFSSIIKRSQNNDKLNFCTSPITLSKAFVKILC